MSKSKKKSSEQPKGKQLDGLSADWQLANNAAAEWARHYGFDLVRGITNTTRDRLQREIASFVQNGETLGQLRERLADVFGAARAKVIAITETTRAFGKGNREAWRESGVVNGRRWNTNKDELVCPICLALDGQIVGLDEPFQHPTLGPIDGVPGHPGCRCWETPEVDPPEGFEDASNN